MSMIRRRVLSQSPLVAKGVGGPGTYGCGPMTSGFALRRPAAGRPNSRVVPWAPDWLAPLNGPGYSRSGPGSRPLVAGWGVRRRHVDVQAPERSAPGISDLV